MTVQQGCQGPEARFLPVLDCKASLAFPVLRDLYLEFLVVP
jgi:hypothetical protein